MCIYPGESSIVSSSPDREGGTFTSVNHQCTTDTADEHISLLSPDVAAGGMFELSSHPSALTSDSDNDESLCVSLTDASFSDLNVSL